MWSRSILTILYLIIATVYAVPSNYGSDDSDEDGLVYVFNIYAVRNTKTETVGKILNDQSMIKVPANFEPIGSVILADDEADEPFTMGEFAEFLEEMGVTVEKLNEEDDAKVIEIKLDISLEDFDDFVSFEEIVRVLQAEGIILEVTEENGAKVVQVEFDESRKNVEDQPFTLEELGKFFESEGFTVEYITSLGSVRAIKIKFDIGEDDSKQSIEPVTTVSTIEKKTEKKDERKSEDRDEKKIEKNNEKSKERKNERDDQFLTLDFTTKSESLNKIRRRRSACPECKAAGVIKAYVDKYETH